VHACRYLRHKGERLCFPQTGLAFIPYWCLCASWAPLLACRHQLAPVGLWHACLGGLCPPCTRSVGALASPSLNQRCASCFSAPCLSPAKPLVFAPMNSNGCKTWATQTLPKYQLQQYDLPCLCKSGCSMNKEMLHSCLPVYVNWCCTLVSDHLQNMPMPLVAMERGAKKVRLLSRSVNEHIHRWVSKQFREPVLAYSCLPDDKSTRKNVWRPVHTCQELLWSHRARLIAGCTMKGSLVTSRGTLDCAVQSWDELLSP